MIVMQHIFLNDLNVSTESSAKNSVLILYFMGGKGTKTKNPKDLVLQYISTEVSS